MVFGSAFAWTCGSCGEETHENVKFCGVCGHPSPVPQQDAAPTPTPASSIPRGGSYAKVVGARAVVFQSDLTTAISKLSVDTLLSALNSRFDAFGVEWVQVETNGTFGYMLRDDLQLLSDDEYLRLASGSGQVASSAQTIPTPATRQRSATILPSAAIRSRRTAPAPRSNGSCWISTPPTIPC